MYFRSEVIGVRKTADNGSERLTDGRRKNRNFPKSRPIAIKLGRLVALAALNSKTYTSLVRMPGHAHSDYLKSRLGFEYVTHLKSHLPLNNLKQTLQLPVENCPR